MKFFFEKLFCKKFEIYKSVNLKGEFFQSLNSRLCCIPAAQENKLAQGNKNISFFSEVTVCESQFLLPVSFSSNFLLLSLPFHRSAKFTIGTFCLSLIAPIAFIPSQQFQQMELSCEINDIIGMIDEQQ